MKNEEQKANLARNKLGDESQTLTSKEIEHLAQVIREGEESVLDERYRQSRSEIEKTIRDHLANGGFSKSKKELQEDFAREQQCGCWYCRFQRLTWGRVC
jgi:hypothetical protein